MSPGVVHAVMDWLWRTYFRPRTWETTGHVYEALGVRQMKEFYFGGRYLNSLISVVRGRTYRPFRGRGWPRRWLRFTVVVELGHACIGLTMLASAADHLAQGDVRSGVSALVINALVNVYPVMVQRYNRARLVRIFDFPRLAPASALRD